ncbi:amidohydrolase family protein [Nakamurella sp.]|uniref:amidohydrolase family protein n=1 Tax=Nakamurella sp. TaxID=1869182 RepID=UPI0037839062
MLAIRCAALFDGASFAPGPATVYVDGAVITGTEPGHPPVGDAVELVDLGEVTLLPGLIDTHVHLVADSGPRALDLVEGYSDGEIDAVVTRSLAAQLAGGVTTVRDLGDRRFVAVDRRDAQRAGRAGPVEPTILASGPPLTVPRGHCWYLGGEVDGPAEIENAVAERIDRRVDVVKVMASGGMNTTGSDVMVPQFSLGEMQLIVAMAHGAGVPVTAHAHALAAVEVAVAAGVDGLEHCSCLTPRGLAMPDALLSVLAGRATPIGAGMMAGGVAAFAEAPPNVIASMTRMGLTPQIWIDSRRALVGRMHAAGARFVGGSDAGIEPYLGHGLMRSGLDFLVSAGATVPQALAAGTSLAADACGLGSRKGWLRAGVDADLIVVDGFFGVDLAPLARVRQVMVGGAFVGSETR